MSFEVEIKFRVSDHAALGRLLEGLGAVAEAEIDQDDAYLAHPSRDFARTDEALRIRRDGPVNRLTYKGPKRGGPTKTREEIEIPYADGEEARSDLLRMMDRLGFRPIAQVRKRRRSYRLIRDERTLVVALDLAEHLGAFAEVEAIARDEDDLPACQATVQDLAAVLGLREVEPRSYLRMTLERATRGTPDRSGRP